MITAIAATQALLAILAAPQGASGAGAPPASAPAAAQAVEIRSGLALAAPTPRSASRSIVRFDALEAQMVAGTFATPVAGAVPVPSRDPTAKAAAWTPVEAGPDGTFAGGPGSAFAGGWLHATHDSPSAQVMLLEAQGHGSVFVNGEARGGDPYSWGFVRIPVLVKAGRNEFLFSVGRGSLRARLVAPPAPAYVADADMVVPSLVAGRDNDGPVGVLVVNASDAPLRGARVALECDLPDGERWVELHSMPPLTVKKVSLPARFKASSVPAPGKSLQAGVRLVDREGRPLGGTTVRLQSVAPTGPRTVTRTSTIDGSAQYYALVPSTADRAKGDPAPGILYSLHGAGVEATGQAACYAPKREAHVVCPTNRRPFGFDWEDWGRLDFAEAFAHARSHLSNDPLRSWLTGHSMGGHGTWQLGAHFPGEFAAIAPSAGWISFASYAGATAAGPAAATAIDPAAAMLLRAGRASDTLALKQNYLQQGIYVLHGDADDNVPVSEAREMFRQMAAINHPDFACYERCGAGHWWGNECVDWPPLTQFLFRHALPKPGTDTVVRFHTVAPQVSSRNAWVRVLQQERPFELSSVEASVDAAKQSVTVATGNVVRIDLDPPGLAPGAPVNVEIDGQRIETPAFRADATVHRTRIHLVRAPGRDGKASWTAEAGTRARNAEPHEKKPARGGPFKNAFTHGFVAVVGTQGGDAADALLAQKARYDADQWWVRGNGRFEIVADTAFDPAAYRGRNVVLYGNRDENAAWAALIGTAPPVDVRNGAFAGPTSRHQGEDIAAMFVLPRADCDQGQVGVIAATGAAGMRAVMRTPVFSAGVGIPDLVAFRASLLTEGASAIVEAGFFGNDWGIDTGTWIRR